MTAYPSHIFNAQHKLFKAYDIRGQRSLFTQPFVYALSHTFAHTLTASIMPAAHFGKNLAQQNKLAEVAPHIVIGYDARHGSAYIAKQLAKTFCDYGFKVIWLGLITTPIMAFWANEYDGHGFIATASHSTADINGIKWLLASESPSSQDIQHIYENLDLNILSRNKHFDINKLNLGVAPEVHSNEAKVINDANTIDGFQLSNQHNLTVLPHEQVSTQYFLATKHALSKLKPDSNTTTDHIIPKQGAKIVIDCLNGATAPFAKDFFLAHPNLCREVIVINDIANGDFPKGNPDPTEPNRLNELSATVIKHQADIGFGFDGDGDRLMVVDNYGNVLAPDHLLYLLSRVAIDDANDMVKKHSNQPLSLTTHENSSPAIIFDVKCSHHLPQLIKKIGATPQISKTGSSIMRRALQTTADTNHKKAIFAGELSGHFMFNDGLFILHDDAMYAALRLLHWLYFQTEMQVLTNNRSTSLALTPQNEIIASVQAFGLAAIINQLPQMVCTPDVYLSLEPFISDTKKEASILNKLTNLRLKLREHCDDKMQTNKIKQTQFCQSALIRDPNKFGLPSNTRLTCIDGIRLDFSNGFGVIRPSNTINSLTVRFSANNIADLKEIQQYFVNLCKPINDDLAKQIAKISASA